MGFTANLRNSKQMYRYEDCEYLFTKPANLRRMGWGADKRPLDDLCKTHLRVERYDGYYDVMLYRTAMARYFKPQMVDGVEVREVHYNCHPSQTSTEFQWRVLGVGRQFARRTTDGRMVNVGIDKDVGGSFPVRLYYEDSKLNVAKSVDAPWPRPSTTSPERKLDRRNFRKWLHTYEAMAKIMEDRNNWFTPHAVKAAYLSGEPFDPTQLCGCITAKGAAWVVNQVFPLGDVEHWDSPFEEIA